MNNKRHQAWSKQFLLAALLSAGMPSVAHDDAKKHYVMFNQCSCKKPLR